MSEAGPAPPAFDRYGNANFDANGTYIGGHGIGTQVDNPDRADVVRHSKVEHARHLEHALHGVDHRQCGIDELHQLIAVSPVRAFRCAEAPQSVADRRRAWMHCVPADDESDGRVVGHAGFQRIVTAASALRLAAARAAAPEVRGRKTSYALRRSHRLHHRDRPVHGEHGRDGHFDFAAGHRARPASGSDRPQARAHLLHVDARGVHSRLRLGRRPLRRAHGVLQRDHRLHARLDPVRRLVFAFDPHRRARVPGAGRSDDGAGWAAGAVAFHSEERSRQRDGLSHRAGADRPGRRSAARRLHHHLFSLALDLLDQRADRHSRRAAVAQVHREFARAGRAALRFQGIRLVGRRPLEPHIGLEHDRARHRALLAGRGDDRDRRAFAGRLRPARSCERGRHPGSQAPQNPDLLRRRRRRASFSASALAPCRSCCRCCCRSGSA